MVNDDGIEIPVKWECPDAEPIPGEAERGKAFAIDHDGRIVGNHAAARAVTVPYMWDADGNGEELPQAATAMPRQPA